MIAQGGAVIIGLSKSIDRQQARDLVEVRSGWTLVAALASGRVMSDKVAKADLLVFEDTLAHVDLVMAAVRSMQDPPALAILSVRSPGVVARELGCVPHDVISLSPGVSLNAAMLRILAAFESKQSSDHRTSALSTSAPSSSVSSPSAASSSARPAPSARLGARPDARSAGAGGPGPGAPPAARLGRTMSPGAATSAPTPRVRVTGPAPRRELLVIGASTGGPDALGVVLSGLPRDFSAPILITQHMPRTFTELLAATLDRSSPFTVREAKHGDVATAGCAYIAPGGSHMVLVDRLGTIALNEDPPEHNCRPSLDVLFRSAAATFGRACVAVVLTGMGSDGAIGAAGLADLGAHVIAQDRETSVVWGMPGAVVQRDAADQVLPLKEIATAISLQFKRNVPSSTASRRAPSGV